MKQPALFALSVIQQRLTLKSDREHSRRLDAAIALVQHRQRLLRLATDALQDVQREIGGDQVIQVVRHKD